MKKVLFTLLSVVAANAMERNIECPPAPSRGRFTQCYNYSTDQWENRETPAVVSRNILVRGDCPPAPRKGYFEPVRVVGGWLLQKR